MLILKMTESFWGPSLVAGVIDGVSGLYEPSGGPQLFNGKSGGQAVCEIVNQIISNTQPSESLEDLLLAANEKIELHAISQGIHLNRSDILPGAAFAIAKVDQETVEIIQGADCLAVWQKSDGVINATRNQVFPYEAEWRRILTNLLGKYEGDRNKAWEQLIPVLCADRLERVNRRVSGYALLNGQQTLSECWQKITFPRADIRFLFLFTDGLIPFEESGNAETLGKMIVSLFKQGGLKAILERTRSIEEATKTESHIDHAEATGIAIEP